MSRRWMSPLALCLAGCEVLAPSAPTPVGQWTTVDLNAAMVAPDAQFLDARSLEAFEAGHIPGALHLDPDDLRATLDGVDGQALDRDTAIPWLEGAGIDAAQPVWVYGAANDTRTSRLFWSLAYYGSLADLRLVDGGITAWTEAGLGLEVGTTTTTPLLWEGAPTRETLRVDQDWMLEHLDDPDVIRFDVRAPSEYEAGHIPGAVHVNWTENLGGDGRFLPATDVLQNHGNPTHPTVVVYCHSGARASVTWALLTSAGLPDVRLYDGSWTEWGNDPDTPKVVGTEP